MNTLDNFVYMLEAGIKASGLNMEVFGYQDEEVPNAVYMAEKEDGEVQIVIQIKDKLEIGDTIFGPQGRVVPQYHVWLPKYDSGDWSVGIQAGYITDPYECEPDLVTPMSGTAIEFAITQVITEYVRNAVECAGEYLYFQSVKESDQW